MRLSIALLALLTLCPTTVRAQEPPPPAFRTGTTLVLVPALVRDHSGAPVYSLTAEDFLVTDDGQPQQLTLEPDTDREPLALAVLVQVGGAGTRHLDDYRDLGTTIEALIGDVPHRVSLIGFDSTARTIRPFTADTDRVAEDLHDLQPGDAQASIYDGLRFAVEQLQSQPAQYRRAVLLISETVDHGSQTALEEAVRAVSDTNTIIYSFAFSSTRSAATDEASRIMNDPNPGPPGGCFATDPNEAPARHKKKLEKTYDCLGLLAPPLRLAKIAAMVAANEMKRNAPETVAQLTGGEFYSFRDRRSLEKAMLTVANHVPNRYVLSFRPVAPHPGLHTIVTRVKDETKLSVTARRSYWAENAALPPP